MDETVNLEDAIRVVVSPSQASYFAGEPFSVTVTFTNTRGPDVIVPRSVSHSALPTHKRSAHSISSVPLARPPTSPGTARSPHPSLPVRPAESPVPSTRKGLIGKGSVSNGPEDASGSVDYAARKPLVKSLSISITSDELLRQAHESSKGKSPLNPLRANDSLHASPTSPRIPSPLTRSATFPAAPTHPHARKQSVMDAQLQVQDLRPPPIPSPFSPPSASTSTYSLSLDPISEGSSPTVPPMTPAIPSPIPETHATFRTQIPSVSKPNGTSAGRAPPHRRPAQLGHGPPPGTTAARLHNQPPRTPFSSSFPLPNTELILYSYALLVGTMSLTPGTPSTPEQARALNHVRSSLLKRQVVGGGSMDITPLLSSQPFGSGHRTLAGHPGRPSRGRSSSVSSSLLSLLSPTSLAPSPAPSAQSWAPSHRARAPSMFSLFSSGQTTGPSGVGLGFGAGVGTGGGEEDVDPEVPLPTLDMQPSMLAVDLTLAPGESRSYTYTVVLPENLPPTFRGRSLRLSYQFILGVCRAAPSTPYSGLAPTGANSSSRVMKVPIRVYNNVTVGKQPRPYDLLWPVSFWKSRGAQCSAKVIEEPKHPPKAVNQLVPSGVPSKLKSETFEDLQTYARNLLSSFHDHDPNVSGVRIKLPLEALELEREEVGGLAGCRQAVEILTRNPRKASYDVNKDGVKVAVLTFTKSAYRLGETVLGVVELNERSSRARVLKLSALLEAHESLPSSISSVASPRQMRRVHAEHHSSFVPSALRTTFSLDIPPDASPAFQVDVGGDAANAPPRSTTRPGGLEWKVRLCLLVAVASPTSREGPDGLRLRHLVHDGPPGEWGASWKAASSIAPMERPDHRAAAGAEEKSPITPGTAASWISYFTAPLLGPSTGYHDGDEVSEEETGGEKGEGDTEAEWREVKAEMVECEVPIKVWPGNTVFKATEVVFDV